MRRDVLSGRSFMLPLTHLLVHHSEQLIICVLERPGLESFHTQGACNLLRKVTVVCATKMILSRLRWGRWVEERRILLDWILGWGILDQASEVWMRLWEKQILPNWKVPKSIPGIENGGFCFVVLFLRFFKNDNPAYWTLGIKHGELNVTYPNNMSMV